MFLKDRPTTIAELVPNLEHLGLVPVDEQPSVFANEHATVYLDDVGVQMATGSLSDGQHAEMQESFIGLMNGTIEPDGLNRLVLGAGLDRRQVAVLRTYTRYLRQAAFAFSSGYVTQAVVRHPEIARALAHLFDAKFDPRLQIEDTARVALVASVRSTLLQLLDAVPSLDDDRICRALLTLIDATVRTTAFCGHDEVSFKLRPHAHRIPAGTAARVRDLRVFAQGRGGPPARGPDRPWGSAVERSARGLPHRGARVWSRPRW